MTPTQPDSAGAPPAPPAPPASPPSPAGRSLLTKVMMGLAGLLVVVSIGTPLLGLRAFHGAELLYLWPPWSSEVEAHGQDNPYGPITDTIDFYLPLRHEFAGRIWDGDFPLWSSDAIGGQPLGAVPDVGTLSPLNSPFWVLPSWLAPGYSKLLEMAVALGFTALFLRRLSLSRPAALLGGIVFANSGFQVAWTNWPHTHVAALIPALFWAVERHLQERSRRSLVPVALVAALMLLEGFPSIAGFAVAFVGPYVLVRLALQRARPRELVGRSMAVAAGLVLGVGVAAAQVLPFLLRLRDLGLDRTQDSEGLPFHFLATLAVPHAFGSQENFFAELNFMETQSFVGAVAVVLAVVALARGPARALPRGVFGFLVGAIGVVVLVTFVGGPPLALLQHVPPFDLNPIGRMRALLGFFLAVMAAVGFDALLFARSGPVLDAEGTNGWSSRRQERGSETPRWRRWGVPAAAVLLAGYGLAQVFQVARDEGHVDFVRSAVILPAVVAVVTVAAAVLALRVRRPGVRHLVLAIVPVALVVESLAFVLPTWPRIAVDRFYPTTPAHEFLEANLDGDRYAAEGATLYPGTNIYYGIRTVSGSLFHQPTWADLMRRVNPEAFSANPYVSFLTPHYEVASSPILDRLAARYFANGPTQPVYGEERVAVVAGGSAVEVRSGNPGPGSTGPGAALRAVTVTLAEPAPTDLDPTAHLVVTVGDGRGGVLAEGRRRLDPPPPAGPLTVAVAAEEAAGAAAMPVEVTLEGTDDALVLATSDAGLLAMTFTVAPPDDGLELVFTEGANLYRREHALPRVRWASRPRVVADPAERIELLAGGLPDDVVLLEDAAAVAGIEGMGGIDRTGGPGGAGEAGGAGGAGEADDAGGRGDSSTEVEVVVDGEDEVVARVDAERDGFLVLAEAAQMAWRVEVDGERAELLDADHALVAVRVPEGEHEVRFLVDPPGWFTGRLLTLASLLALLALALGPEAVRRTQASLTHRRTRRPGVAS